MENPKRRFGDRRDGYWLRDLDSMHGVTPYLYPNRADNEAFIQERIDLTPLIAYLEKKNAENPNPEFKYTFFHALLAAFVKTVTLRPKMNRFIQGNRIYQRNELTAAFVIKKQFNDESHEALAFLHFGPESTLDTIHQQLYKEIHTYRHTESVDNTTQAMDMFMKFPRWVLRIAMAVLRRLDYYGRVPLSLCKTDPNYATVFLSNLGSIKLNAAYHHLNNWGTNSFFVTIGEKHMAPFYDAEGNVTMRPSLNLGLTIDERIADGYYYSKTVKLLKHILANPELLDQPANVEVDYE